jgi:hemoglobin-like flavoprotein
VYRRPDPADVRAIQASLAAVQKRPVQLTEVFYAHLFEMAPSARTMFPGDLTEQMQKMTITLLSVIATLSSALVLRYDDEQITALEQALQRLGAIHHDKWQVRPEHYQYIPHALTRAVRDVAGATWCGALSSSWIALIQWINGHMLVGTDQSAMGDDSS